MTNAIRSLTLKEHRVDSAQAEIWVTVTAERHTATTDVRGKFVGPRCANRNTVEVALPLRPVPGLQDESASLTRRVVIPDPSLWTPESPFTYEGKIELWEAGQRCDVGSVLVRLGQAKSSTPKD